MADIAVIHLNMGGPASAAEVGPFLEALFSDPALIRLPWYLRPFQGLLARTIARKRTEEATRNYDLIGGCSPLLPITEAQAAGVARALAERGHDALGLVAMRYTAPRADEAIAAARRAGVERIVALTLYPHFSDSTTGTSLLDLRAARRRVWPDGPELIEIREYPEADFYVDTVVDQVTEVLERMGDPSPHVLFSSHGLPQEYVDRGDPYRDQIGATFDRVRERLPAGIACSLSFQSRVGPKVWLKPYTEVAVVELARQGVERLVIAPLGFVSEHVETLYEMDMLYADAAREAGVKEVQRVPTPGEHPRFIATMGGDSPGTSISVPIGMGRAGPGRVRENTSEPVAAMLGTPSQAGLERRTAT